MSERRSRRKQILMAAGAAAGLLMACGVFFLEKGPARVAPGTVIRGVELGGMTAEEAADALKEGLYGQQEYSPDTVQTSWEVRDGQLIFTMGRAGVRVEEQRLEEELREAVRTGEYENLDLCLVQTGAVELVDLDAVASSVCRETQDASLDPEHDYEVTESVTGVDFDRELAGELLSVAEEGSVVAVDLICTEPEITTQELKERLFADRLAEYTTRVTSNENYITNVRLAAERCNGTILLPGEVFSFNDTVGEQNAETGFKKASATRGTEVIQAYGGGICQVSSTLFAAALYAGLEIPERWCHTYVCTYMDPGMDAAVAWDVLDFQIANGKEYPVKLEVRYADRYLTVTILGTKTKETPIEIVTETEESPADLLRISTYRRIYSSNGEHVFIEKVGDSEYLDPWRKVD